MAKDKDNPRYCIVRNGRKDHTNSASDFKYASYEVWTNEGTFTCAFFGGGSHAAAQLWADHLNSLEE